MVVVLNSERHKMGQDFRHLVLFSTAADIYIRSKSLTVMIEGRTY